MLHSSKLRYLDAIARCGSIRAAATELNVASSAINRQLLALEADLGAPLFERIRRRLKLTSVGEIVIGHIRETLKEEGRMQARIAALRGVQRGKISIAMTLGLADGVMAEIIGGFIDRRPGIQVSMRSMRTDEIGSVVVNGDIDLGLGYYLMPNPALQPLFMMNTDFGVVVAPDHPLAQRRAVRLSNLIGYETVLPETGSSMRNTLERAFLRYDVSIQPIVETNSIITLKRLVAASMRCTLLNPFDVATECAEGTLVFRPIVDGPLPRQALTLVTRSRRTPDPLISLFAEELRQMLPKITDAAIAGHAKS